MSIADKLTKIAENTPKVFNAGYKKGYEQSKVDNVKAEQEKTVNITYNGTTEVLPDENKTISKVTVNVNVPNDDSLIRQLIDGTITEIVIPNDVTTINDYAFASCEHLSKIEIPDSVTLIKAYAFAYCYDLTDVYFSENSKIKSIQNYAFVNCGVLENINLPNKLTSISIYAFRNCSALTQITLPQGFDWLANQAFNGSGLTTINLPNSITRIDEKALDGCAELTNLTVECEIKTNFNLAQSSKLTDESIQSIVDGYADMTGQTSPILTVHPDVKAKIEANSTWLNTLINKNVTLA